MNAIFHYHTIRTKPCSAGFLDQSFAALLAYQATGGLKTKVSYLKAHGIFQWTGTDNNFNLSIRQQKMIEFMKWKADKTQVLIDASSGDQIQRDLGLRVMRKCIWRSKQCRVVMLHLTLRLQNVSNSLVVYCFVYRWIYPNTYSKSIWGERVMKVARKSFNLTNLRQP